MAPGGKPFRRGGRASGVPRGPGAREAEGAPRPAPADDAAAPGPVLPAGDATGYRERVPEGRGYRPGRPLFLAGNLFYRRGLCYNKS